MRSVEVIQVIKTELTKRGAGTDADPVRCITQYWHMDGRLLYEMDGYEQDTLQRKVNRLKGALRDVEGALFLFNADPKMLAMVREVLES